MHTHVQRKYVAEAMHGSRSGQWGRRSLYSIFCKFNNGICIPVCVIQADIATLRIVTEEQCWMDDIAEDGGTAVFRAHAADLGRGFEEFLRQACLRDMDVLAVIDVVIGIEEHFCDCNGGKGAVGGWCLRICAIGFLCACIDAGLGSLHVIWQCDFARCVIHWVSGFEHIWGSVFFCDAQRPARFGINQEPDGICVGGNLMPTGFII